MRMTWRPPILWGTFAKEGAPASPDPSGGGFPGARKAPRDDAKNGRVLVTLSYRGVTEKTY